MDWSRNENGGELSRKPRRTAPVFLMLASVGLSCSLTVCAEAPVASSCAASNRLRGIIKKQSGVQRAENVTKYVVRCSTLSADAESAMSGSAMLV